MTALAAQEERDFKAEERRSQILEAATRAFARKGYHNTTMDDIVRESGLSKGAIYWYFKGKKEIFLALADQLIASDQKRIVEAVNKKTSAIERLWSILQMVAGSDEYAECEGPVEPDVRKLIGEFWQQAVIDPEVNTKFKEIYDFWKSVGVQLIEECIATGELRVKDAEAITAILIAVFDGLSWHWLINVTSIKGSRLISTLFDMLKYGIVAEPD